MKYVYEMALKNTTVTALEKIANVCIFSTHAKKISMFQSHPAQSVIKTLSAVETTTCVVLECIFTV